MMRVHVLGRLLVVFDSIAGAAAGLCVNHQTLHVH